VARRAAQDRGVICTCPLVPFSKVTLGAHALHDGAPTAMRRGKLCAVLLLGLAVGTGCRRWISLPPADVGSVAAYGQSRTVTATEPGQKPITIEPGMEPVLRITAKQPCVRDAAETCQQDAVVPLAAVSPEGGRVVTRAPAPICDDPLSFDLDQVQRAVLQVGNAGIPLSRDQLSPVLAYAESRRASVRYGNQTFEVEPQARPVLYLEFGSCSIFQSGCSDHPIRVALEAVTLEGAQLRVCRGASDVVAAPGDILLAELGLRHAPALVPHTGRVADRSGLRGSSRTGGPIAVTCPPLYERNRQLHLARAGDAGGSAGPVGEGAWETAMTIEMLADFWTRAPGRARCRGACGGGSRFARRSRRLGCRGRTCARPTRW